MSILRFWKLWAGVGWGGGSPGTNPLQVPRDNCTSYQGLSTWFITVDTNLDLLAEAVCQVSPLQNYSFSFLSILDYFERSHYASSTLHLWSGKLCFTFLKADYLHKLFGFPLHGKFVSFLPYIYLFKNSRIPVWTRGYLFYTLSYNTLTLFILFLKLFELCTTCFSRLCVPLTYPHYCICVFVIFFQFLFSFLSFLKNNF